MSMSDQPVLHSISCPDAAGGHRMAYWQWGDAAHPHVVVCAHGLSRQGRDFDVLARALCQRAGGALRVICPDVVGRGRSDWLRDPSGYQVPAYAADMLALLAHLHAQAPMGRLDWLGTSMGGLIGMVLAGQPGLPLPVALRRLVLNDVGPDVQWVAIQRIAGYLGRVETFDSVQAAADLLWARSTEFGPHTPQQWLELSRHMVRPASGGTLTLHYDPAIAVPLGAMTEASLQRDSATLWALYDNINAQVLLLRGAQSDLLTRATAQAMTQRGPKATLIEFAGVGHAPTFVAADQIDAVTHFLLD
ncbi:MAG: alpha/beta hydrolase [Burkholderiaceae bacterium]|nr:alpha/beta hydrolase [Burkholderiaceae bacterium]MDP1968314.1 alpha/beta hydrolase [Burkholderiaceae bacterium]